MKHLQTYKLFEEDAYYTAMTSGRKDKKKRKKKAPAFDINKVAKAAEKKIVEDPKLKAKIDNLEESVLALAAGGALLGLGRLAHIASTTLTMLGLEFGKDEQHIINKAAAWLKDQGDRYSVALHKNMMDLLKKIPALKNFMNAMDPEQRSEFCNLIVSIGIVMFAGELTTDAYDFFVSNHSMMNAISHVDHSFIASLEGNMPSIIKATVDSAIEA